MNGLVRKLDELIKSDMAYEEICETVQEYTKHTGLVFMLKSSKNFAANGRVSPLVQSLLASQ